MPFARRFTMGLLQVGGAILLASGCGPSTRRPTATFTVVAAHLEDYALQDRDGDYQADDPKPLAEREAAWTALAGLDPDLLLIQGLGQTPAWRDLQEGLASRGYNWTALARGASSKDAESLGVFSRVPLGEIKVVTNLVYSVAGHPFQVTPPLLDLQVPGLDVRVVVAEIRPPRALPETDAYEMRRNELRLVAQYVNGILREAPETRLLVAASLNEEPDAPPLRMYTESAPVPLVDLRPTDVRGDAWTRHDAASDRWFRHDYLLASPALVQAADPHTDLPDPPEFRRASSRRPLRLTWPKPRN